jgi:integrase
MTGPCRTDADTSSPPRSVRVHGIRHTCASLLLAQGVPMRVIMETLGHSNISMTMDVYTHVMDTALRDAADGMDSLLGADTDETTLDDHEE